MTPRTKKCFISFGSGTQTKFRKASSLNFTLTSDCWGWGGEGRGISVGLSDGRDCRISSG